MGRSSKLAALMGMLALAAGVAGVRAEPARTAGVATTFSVPGGDGPIVVTADELELDYRNNIVTCRGSVVAQQGGVQLESATLTVTFARGENGKPARVLAAVADGGVKIVQGERWATAGRATFDQQKRTLTLTEHPVLHEGANQVSGDRVIVYLDEGRNVVEGGRGRVKAVLHEGGGGKRGTSEQAQARTEPPGGEKRQEMQEGSGTSESGARLPAQATEAGTVAGEAEAEAGNSKQ